jgi:Tfp pilus assembly protein FimV
MTIGDREGLMARIRQIRRLAAARDRAAGEARDPQPDRLQALEARVAHLERQLDGLQDSVHRESERHASLIAELRTQVQPGAMGAALAEDARNRGL